MVMKGRGKVCTGKGEEKRKNREIGRISHII